MELNKTYDPSTIEKKWYAFWNDKGYFKPNTENKKPSTQNLKPFSIVIPPPNVTGILHMGHVLNNTLQDVAIRYNRMLGRPTLWIPGTDHAGIATQNVVEKELAKEGLTRHKLGREELVKRIWEYKEQKGNHIIEQLKQLGCSCDWSRLRFTMDEGLSDAVKKVFIHLYQKDLIYKGKFIINWCPRCVTALANDEVEYEDKAGKLWYIRYPIAGVGGRGSGVEDTTRAQDVDFKLAGYDQTPKTENYIVIATTRPETMLGDVAVAVNPKDERYAHLIGQQVILPLTDRLIPIIADDYVDKEFGTGCVKITPAHDPNDFEVGLRHNLPQLTIMDEHAKINENVPQYQGLDRYEARKKIIEQLTALNLIEKIEEHQHSVGCCYRCDTVVEPYLSDQWFVRMKPLAKRAIEVVENGEIKLVPDRWTKVYMHWMNNIRDWCISRQIWWGHRIPAYYCQSCGNMIVAIDQPDMCPKCRSERFKQEEDVLDTWFSSWIWPFSTMGWPEKTPELDYFLPTNLLVTAHEIIYLWVARMVMATLEFQNKIPFETVFFNGIVRDKQGRKMSKSLGNSPDPIDLINNVGADALRFSMVFNTPRGQDSYYSDEILETGRNFCNKIWNAFRFIMLNVPDSSQCPVASNQSTEAACCVSTGHWTPDTRHSPDLADRWIYSRLHTVTKQVNDYYQNLRFNDAAQTLMQFIWDEFCSWYVEMAKERLYQTSEDRTQTSEDRPQTSEDSSLHTSHSTLHTLLDVLQSAMRLLHPIMPFISEEIWQHIKPLLNLQEDALIIATFPQTNESLIDPEIEAAMALIQETIVAIRNLRKQLNISPAINVDIILKVASSDQIKLYSDYTGYIRKLAKVQNIQMGQKIDKPASSMVAVIQDIQIILPLTDLIDIAAEKAKLQKHKEKLESELSVINNKLTNEKFLANAKPEVIDKEKEKQTEVQTKLNTLLEVIKGLGD